MDNHPIMLAGTVRLSPTTNHPKKEESPQTNTIGELRKRLFAPQDALVRTVVQQNKETLGIVQTIQPTKPYAPHGVMISAGSYEIILNQKTNPQEITKTLCVQDLPQRVQEEYYRQICLALIRLPNAIAVENATKDINWPHKRETGRSITLPHSQVFSLWKHSDTQKPYLPGEYLLLERSIMADSQQTQTFLTRLCADIQHSLGVKMPCETLLRTTIPHGYTFLFTTITKKNLLQQSVLLTSFFAAHLLAYTKNLPFLLQEYAHDVEKIGLLDQPSFRVYIWFFDEKLQITISPKLFSSTGVLEAAGVQPL